MVDLKEEKQYSVLIAFFSIIYIPKTIYADFFLYLSGYFDSTSVIHSKLTDFAIFIQMPEFTTTTEAGGRAERYPILFKAFVPKPHLGTASSSETYNIGGGGHLFWMNRLTQWGILGFSAFIYMLYTVYKKIHSLFDNEFGYYYSLSILAFVMLGLVKNIAGREPYLMLLIIIPGLYFTQFGVDKKGNSTI
ncbi:MAG: hypothetical protein U5R06_03895 [candidate division KSB1 bacterium]|nr:hypothetical protein [candidate division KSB1 bacterium]